MHKYKITMVFVLLITIILGGCLSMELSSETDYEEAIGTFSLTDYTDDIKDFPVDKILGPVETFQTARERAEIVWIEVYGESIKDNKPYGVSFDEESQVWLVQGSLPENWLGGVPHILIQKSDGKVLAVWHTK